MVRFGKVLGVVLLVALVSFSALNAQPQAEVEFWGEITAVTQHTITVNNQIIDVQEADLQTDLNAGVEVKVEARLESDGRIIAHKVEAASDLLFSSTVRIQGLIKRLETDALHIGGLAINLTAEVLADLQQELVISEKVTVFADVSESGILSAVRILPAGEEEGSAELELTGTLEAIGDGSIEVSGQILQSANAEIDTVLVTGALVNVEIEVEGHMLVMLRIEYADTDNDNIPDDNHDESDKDENDGQPGDDTGEATVCATVKPSGWLTYQVAAGDTLSQIAVSSGTTVDVLVQVNCIQSPSTITVGSEIYIPALPQVPAPDVSIPDVTVPTVDTSITGQITGEVSGEIDATISGSNDMTDTAIDTVNESIEDALSGN